MVSRIKTHTQTRRCFDATLEPIVDRVYFHGGDVSSAVLCVFMIDLPPKSMRDLDSTTSGVPSYFPMRVAGLFM